MKRIGFVALFLFVVCSSVLAEGTWNHVTHVAGQEIGYVTDIVTGKDTTLWVASYNGIFWYKDSVWNYEDSDVNYYHISTAPNGDIWLGGRDAIYKYNNGQTWEILKTSGYIIGISIDKNGVVWCNTQKGVYRYKDSSWKIFTTEDGLADDLISRMEVNPSGEVWISYGEPFEWEIATVHYGVSHFNGDTWETFNIENGLESNMIADITFGPDGSVYVSQDPKGHNPVISKYDGTSWEVVTSISGYLGFDLEGYLWVSHPTKYRIYKYDLTSKTILEEYYVFNFICPPVFLDDGSIWLGMVDGLLLLDTETGITDESNSKPEEFIQLSNYPNPFNASTTLTFTLPEPGHASITIYTSTGQKIDTIADRFMPAGINNVVFNGGNLPSGLYFYRFDSASMRKTGKMLLVK